MKKRVFDKIFAIGGALIAVLFITVLLIAVFGGFKNETDIFDNKLLQGLFMSLAVLYVLLMAGNIAYLFSDNDAVRSIILDAEKGGNTKVSSGVIKSLVRKNVATIPGVTCQRVSLILTEYGVRLKIALKINDREAQREGQEICVLIKCLLEDVFENTLGYRFNAIDFKITSLKPQYEPDMDAIEQRAESELERMKEKYESESVTPPDEENEIEIKSENAE
ncbi:MAG: hypothetical protein GX891_00675 [Clostridiales bacterium]|nr:hypothetical protein [Clostridiales bacterium]